MILSMLDALRLAEQYVRLEISAEELHSVKEPMFFENESATRLLQASNVVRDDDVPKFKKNPEDFHFKVEESDRGSMLLGARWWPETKDIRIFLPHDEVKIITFQDAPWKSIFLASVNLQKAYSPAASPDDEVAKNKTEYECSGWNTDDRVWEYTRVSDNS